MGYSLWGCKESDMSRQLKHTHTHTHTTCFANFLYFCFNKYTLILDTYLRVGKPSVYAPRTHSLLCYLSFNTYSVFKIQAHFVNNVQLD